MIRGRPTPRLKLPDLIPAGDHDGLPAIEARLRRGGVPIDKVTALLQRYAESLRAGKTGAPRRAAQARRLRKLQRDFRAVLVRVQSVYDSDPERASSVCSPIERHVRALLAYLDEVERIGEVVYGPSVRIDFADPLISPAKAPRGPFRWNARDRLRELGVGRRDIAWLMQRATLPR